MLAHMARPRTKLKVHPGEVLKEEILKPLGTSAQLWLNMQMMYDIVEAEAAADYSKVPKAHRAA